MLTSSDQMDNTSKATQVFKMFSEGQRAMESNTATLADAHYVMRRLQAGIGSCDSLKSTNKQATIKVITDKVQNVIYSDAMAMRVAIDPRQDFAVGEEFDKLCLDAQRMLVNRLNMLHDSDIITSHQKMKV